MPGNSTPAERALDRVVLIRLPFEELRQAEQVDEYSKAAVKFWPSNPTSSVTNLINFVSGQAGALLDKNLDPRPTVMPGTAKSAATLAFFLTQELAGYPQRPAHDVGVISERHLTSATNLSDWTVAAVAEIVATCYREFRHAEQDFFAARQTAAEAKGISPNDLAQELEVLLNVADEAVSASLTVLPDRYKRRRMPGDR